MRDLIEELESEEEELKRDDHMSTVLWGRLDLLRLITECKEALKQKDERIAELEELSGVNSAQIKLLGDWLNARGKSMAELEADKAELDSFLWLFIDENKDPEALRRLRDMAAYLHRKHQQPAKEQG
jgi:ABC-type transporter Mla MlaB component